MASNHPREMDFLRRESGLVSVAWGQAHLIASADARRHIREGFARRVYLIQTSRLEIDKIAQPHRRKPLSPYETSNLNVHLNSLYFHVRGALDNLAWALHHELRLLGNKGEADRETQSSCYLFGPKFIKALKSVRPTLAEMLSQKLDWATEFKKLRDPVAHRVPLYAVPGVVDQSAIQHMRLVEAEAIAAVQSGDFNAFRSKLEDSQGLANYIPIIAVSGPSGIELRHLPRQIQHDQCNFLDIGESIVISFANSV